MACEDEIDYSDNEIGGGSSHAAATIIDTHTEPAAQAANASVPRTSIASTSRADPMDWNDPDTQTHGAQELDGEGSMSLPEPATGEDQAFGMGGAIFPCRDEPWSDSDEDAPEESPVLPSPRSSMGVDDDAPEESHVQASPRSSMAVDDAPVESHADTPTQQTPAGAAPSVARKQNRQAARGGRGSQRGPSTQSAGWGARRGGGPPRGQFTGQIARGRGGSQRGQSAQSAGRGARGGGSPRDQSAQPVDLPYHPRRDIGAATPGYTTRVRGSDDHVMPDDGGFMADNGGFIPDDGGFMADDGGFMPDDGGFMADDPSEAFDGTSLDPEGSMIDPSTQQRRIAIPRGMVRRPRLPTIEAPVAQEPGLRRDIAVLQRMLERLQPLDREERDVAERIGMNNPAFLARFVVELHQLLAGAPPPPLQVPAPRRPLLYVKGYVPPEEPPSPGQGDDEDMGDS